jgi:hypothetical protein
LTGDRIPSAPAVDAAETCQGTARPRRLVGPAGIRCTTVRLGVVAIAVPGLDVKEPSEGVRGHPDDAADPDDLDWEPSLSDGSIARGAVDAEMRERLLGRDYGTLSRVRERVGVEFGCRS